MSPIRPTREDAARASRPEEMAEEALSPEERMRAAGGQGKEREERGGADGSGLHPPHRTENFEGAPIQEERASPREVEGLPANASGREEVSVEEGAQPIDAESAYDRRRDEDKDRPPSTRAG